MAKTKFDYTTIGLVKADGVVSFDGKGIDSLPATAKEHLLNYGLFVKLTRALAGHENDTIAEKKALVAETWDWLMADCPKITRTKTDAVTATAKLAANTDKLSAKEKAALQALLEKMKA